MGSYTPNRSLYKPDVGETGWGDKVNQNWDILDIHEHLRAEISDFFSSPFWGNIPDKPAEFPPSPHTHVPDDVPELRDKVAYSETLIRKIKVEMLTIALNVMMHKALLNAETKDFYSIIADVTTPEYPNGFKNTLILPTAGVTFDNDGGGIWTQAIKIPLTTTPSEHAQYRIVIQSSTMQIYAADGTLKAEYGAQTGIASDFWNNVKSDGSDIRVADQNYEQLYFWVEEFDYANSYAIIWVRIPEGTSELYIAYGNSQATKSSYEDGEQVFELFDGFDGADISSDFSIVDEDTGFSYTLENSQLVVTMSGSYSEWQHFVIQSTQQFSSGYAIGAKITEATGGDNQNKLCTIGFSDFTDENKGHAYNNTVGFSVHLYYSPDKQQHFVRVGGTDYSAEISSQPYPLEFLATWDGDSKLYVDSTLMSTISTVPTTSLPASIYFAIGAGAGDATIKIDYICVAKLADPAEFGTAETITLVTTGDFLTVTFDFPDGVDKLLITVDTDATAVYYSTDDGATWNPITPDTETLLPETAYSVKWKFEFASYVRGYAFITW